MVCALSKRAAICRLGTQNGLTSSQLPKAEDSAPLPWHSVGRLGPELSLLSWLWSPARSRLPSYPCLGLFCIPASKKGSQAEYRNLGQKLMEKYVRLHPHCHPGRWEELQALHSSHVSASLHPASLVKAVHLGDNVCQKDPLAPDMPPILSSPAPTWWFLAFCSYPST